MSQIRIIRGRKKPGIPPPPPPSGPFTPNLPGGLTQQFDTTFENLAATPGSTPGGLEWNQYYSGGASVVSTPDGPHSTSSFQMSFNVGDIGGAGSPALLLGSGGNSWAKMYLALSFRLSPTYVSHSNEEKFWYPRINNGTSLIDSWNFALMPNGAPNSSSTRWQYRSYISGVSNSIPHTTSPFITKGEWVTIEMYCVMNAPNTSNGILKTWINNVAQIDVSDVRYHNTGSEAWFDGVFFDATRGGGSDPSSAVPAEGMTRWYNRLAVHASSSRT